MQQHGKLHRLRTIDNMTAKYPVDIGDDEGIVDAVNYLLSGPSGLGQNFSGFSS